MVSLETAKTGPTRTPDPLVLGDGLPEPPPEPKRSYTKRRTPEEIDLEEKASKAEAREKLRRIWRAKAEKHIGTFKAGILGLLAFVGRRYPAWSPTEEDLPQIDAMSAALALVGAKWEPEWLDDWKEEFDAVTEVAKFAAPKALAAAQADTKPEPRPVEAEVVDGTGQSPHRARKAG